MDRDKIRAVVESRLFKAVVITVIVINAIVIGIQTMQIPQGLNRMLDIFDNLCLLFYIIETALKIYAWRGDYFKQRWNVFDFVVIALSVIPSAIMPIPLQVARVLRLFRVGRVFRLVSAFDQMRVIVEAIGKSIPGIMWTGFMLLVLMYVYDIAGVTLFGEEYPEYFGDLSAGLFTLFQFATLEGWPEIAREVLSVHPAAWFYFISYIVITALIILNVVVGIIVNTVEESAEAARIDRSADLYTQLATELTHLKKQIEVVEFVFSEYERERANEEDD